jgi:glycerate kinase
MKIIVAPDSFKGSLSAETASAAIARGIHAALPEAEVIQIPIADGGEGTLDCLLRATAGERMVVQVTGPLGQIIDAEYGILNEGRIAVIEMAKASGLTLVPIEKRNPMLTTSYGMGELIKAALDAGCRDFILAVGGSASNDGGAGMLKALGMRFVDTHGDDIIAFGGNLGRIAQIDDRHWDTRIRHARFMLASDVQNPWLGDNGATYVFGPQKGATDEQLITLEQNMTHWVDCVEQKTGLLLRDRAGAGAAGGIGGAFLAFFPIEIQRGIDMVIGHTRFREFLADADLVITGEGRIDHQTLSGKTALGIAQEAKRAGVPAVALAGSLGKGIEALYSHGLSAMLSIVNRPMSLQEAMLNAESLLEQAAEQLMRTMIIFHKERVSDED